MGTLNKRVNKQHDEEVKISNVDFESITQCAADRLAFSRYSINPGGKTVSATVEYAYRFFYTGHSRWIFMTSVSRKDKNIWRRMHRYFMKIFRCSGTKIHRPPGHHRRYHRHHRHRHLHLHTATTRSKWFPTLVF